jgi:DsbE subfamily thiol:disulfide oxidoreductase
MPICRLVRLSSLVPLIAAIACGGSSKHAESPASGTAEGKSGPAEVGKPAPDLSIQSLNGKGGVKLEDLAGKVVLVDFWATWCGPCKQSFPALEQLSKRHGSKLAIVGVSVNDEVDGVAEFAKEMGTTFPIGWDEGHAIAQRWNVSTMPSSFIVDEKGTVRFVHAGYHDGDPAEIDKEVEGLLGDAKTAPDTKPAATDAPAKTDAPPDDKQAATDAASDTKPAKPSKKKGGKKKKPKKAPKPAPTTS